MLVYKLVFKLAPGSLSRGSSNLCLRSLTTSCAVFGSKKDFIPPNLDRKGARKFAQRLSLEERVNLLEVLQKLEQAHLPPRPVTEDPDQGQDQLTSTDSSPPRPTSSALYHLAFQQSLPFIGFGFLDNLIMILAGEYIDHNIGITLGISTMAAAALGNTISDLFGIGSAWYVERMAAKLGVQAPALTLEQLELPISRIASTAGRAVGVTIGCLLGMAPLMFQ